MNRFIVTLFVSIALLGCQGGHEGAKQPAAAPSGAGTAASEGAAGMVGKALEKAADPSVSGCLEKVKAKQYAEALPLCLKAANLEPNNSEVASALSDARREASNVASMQKQAEDSLGGVQDAQKAVDSAKKMAPPAMPKMP